MVTGGSKGIGRAIAVAFGAAGAANSARAAEAAAAVVAQIEAAGGHALAVQGDCSKAAAVERLFEQVTEGFGPVDVVVNNAGGGLLPADPGSHRAEFHRLYDINVLGPILTMQRFASQARAPDDISPVAVFLASNDARWITGDVSFAAGGIQ